MQLATLPTDRRPARPVAPVPLVENIPAELKARVQWVLWRYEWKVNTQGIGKWTKVPYGTREVKAATNRPTSWQSFASALARYEANRDYFDGIGYVFAKDDPYVGGDRDHDLSTDGLPATYTETSPSGNGNKFIARASGDYGRKTVRGELYSSGRFFTITGRVLPGREVITDCQAEVEDFAKSLGGTTRKSSGSAHSANGSRAELVKDIPEATWDAARQLSRTEGERVERRVRAAAGGKPHSLLALLLADDYTAAHERYPGKSLYRNDGTLDNSTVRFWIGQGIYGRGFTFIEYVVAMSRICGAKALAKWGTKEAWRQELVAMWNQYPDYTAYTPRPASTRRVHKVKRGRAGDHLVLVEQVYSFLQDNRAGADAMITSTEVARALGCHRRTVMTILGELRDAKRIATRRLPRHGGLVVSFLDVIYSDQSTVVSPQVDAPNLDPPTPALEETSYTNCVSSDRAIDHTLHDAIRAALDALPGKRLNERTGELKAWPRTAKRICAWVAEHYPQMWPRWKRSAPYAIISVRREQRNARFAELHDMTAADLSKELNSVSRTIGRFDRRATEAPTPEIAAWCLAEANKRRGRLAMLATERADRDEREARRLAQFGYSQTEQAEMLAVVEQARDGLAWRPGRAVKVEPDPPPSPSSSPTGEAMRQSLFAALRALQGSA